MMIKIIFSLFLLFLTFMFATVEPAWAQLYQNPGGIIAFTSDATGQDEIYTIQTDGHGFRQLTTNSGTSPDWSPDGNHIVYSSFQGGSYDLFVMDADGTNQRRLVSLPETHEFSAAWSPDGEYIAFIAREQENYRSFGVYRVNSDGTEVVYLSNGFEGNINISPSWSPDSSRIYFLSSQPYEPQRGDLPTQLVVFSVALDGSDLQDFGVGASNPNNAELSPNGQGLIIDSVEGGSRYGQDIYYIDLVEKLGYPVSRNTSEDIDASWSPNGDYIVFSRRDSDRFVLYIMQADGQNQFRLTSTDTGNELSAAWQPLSEAISTRLTPSPNSN